MDAERPFSSPSSGSSSSEQQVSARTHVVSLLLFLLLLTPLLSLSGGCDSCKCLLSLYGLFGTSASGPIAVRTGDAGKAMLFLEIQASGIFTPTGDGRVIPDGATEPAAVDLNLLAEQGYVAVRVPHAPPTYTVTTIDAGQDPGDPGATFTYFYPPTSTVETSVPVTLTRRSELESTLNSRFPITDGRSHWEVWWLPAGAALPMPPGPFRLDPEELPFAFEFHADFGPGAADSCSGCPYQYAAFDGAQLYGPYDSVLVYGNDHGKPRVAFGAHCSFFPPDVQMVSSVLMQPGRPYEFVFCLENYDTFTQTFTVQTTSEQAWAYSYFTQTVVPFGQPAPPRAPVGQPPFQVQLRGAKEWDPGMLIIYAAAVPTFTVGASARELLQIQAQSVISPSMQAATVAVGFSAQYDPELYADRKTYLPTITKE